ncbi:ATP-binding protein [Trujillonella endophytica]|uniref:Predicted ATPase n=1 Tax=Trujillonella endophytica TaxID=673521 RepID=A0A1H8PXX8_9ACTN|nr:helix-turn-helix domain-containing protein [Trujillella endophytica]SEO46839.1 Predicted ATPase [Trujillella endophytica]
MSAATAGPGAFAVRLRRLREDAALTQEELAERAGLTAKAIGALERGERRRPYPHTVRALADALGLDGAGREGLSAAARPTGEAPPNPVLPVPPVPLVGRETEFAEVAALLRDGTTRLLTLTGPGGVGKTSLALEVARALGEDFPDGVVWVDLAPVRDAGLVLATLARAVGGQQPPGATPAALATVLGGRRLLVVLDNLEHLLGAASDVADLLARCPGLVVLATSRAPLRLRAERERPLGPLPLPAGPEVAAVAASPAARVFLDRAGAAGGSVPLTAATAADVEAICRRLDGLPLALELAAAHARYLAPGPLLARLDTALGTPGPRDLPERQRTVRATLDWSHDLLTAGEQVLLRRLAVFRGSFSLDVAQEVAGGDGDVVPALAGLVEQSLVVPLPGPGPRYRLLEPVRQYAAARLAEAGEAGPVADRAADAVRALAGGARTGLLGPDQPAWLDLLEREHGNLAAALARLVGTGRAGAAAELGADTWLYWALRGNAVEGLGWLEPAAAAAGELDAAARAALHLALAGLRYAGGDVPGTAREAAAAADAAEGAGASAEDRHAQALVLGAMAAVFAGELDRAATLLDRVAPLARRIGHEWTGAHTSTARAQLLFRSGDVAAAARELDGAEAAARALGAPFTIALVLNMQGSLALATGEVDVALDRLTEAAELAAAVGTAWTLAYTLPSLAVCAAQRGRHGLAAELFAAGSATAEAGSLAVSFPPDLAAAREWLPVVRNALGEEAFAAAWGRGRALRPADVPGLAAGIGSPDQPRTRRT